MVCGSWSTCTHLVLLLFVVRSIIILIVLWRRRNIRNIWSWVFLPRPLLLSRFYWFSFEPSWTISLLRCNRSRYENMRKRLLLGGKSSSSRKRSKENQRNSMMFSLPIIYISPLHFFFLSWSPLVHICFSWSPLVYFASRDLPWWLRSQIAMTL